MRLPYIFGLPRVLIAGAGSERVVAVLRLANFFRKINLSFLQVITLRYLERSHGVHISKNAEISSDVRFPHPVGIVIGDEVKISSGCTIYQNFTLGGARLGDAQSRNYPTIERESILFAGAVIIGAVKIGPKATVGANAVVTCDVPAEKVAVGVPARVINVNKGHEHE